MSEINTLRLSMVLIPMDVCSVSNCCATHCCWTRRRRAEIPPVTEHYTAAPYGAPTVGQLSQTAVVSHHTIQTVVSKQHIYKSTLDACNSGWCQQSADNISRVIAYISHCIQYAVEMHVSLLVDPEWGQSLSPEDKSQCFIQLN